MTMVVDQKASQKPSKKLGSQGQSVLEFLLLLPMCLGVVMLLIRVNTVIQVSIVDQKYAREQALFISGNAADYPLRASVNSTLAGTGGNSSNQLIMGVSENTPSGAGSNNDADSESSNTLATIFNIGRPSNSYGDNSNGSQPALRTQIRVRDTVNFCLPLLNVGSAPIFNQASGVYTMPESPQAYQGQYCSSSIKMDGST